MIELYFKLKVIGMILGYIALGAFVIFWIVVAIINKLDK